MMKQMLELIIHKNALWRQIEQDRRNGNYNFNEHAKLISMYNSVLNKIKQLDNEGF